METSSFRLPPELIEEIEVVARRRGVTRTEIVRAAVARYLAEAGSAPHLTRLEALDALLADHPGTGRRETAERGEVLLRERFHSKKARIRGAKARPRR